MFSTKPLRACLHGVADPGIVGLVSFVFTIWGTKNKRNLPTRPGSPTPCKQALSGFVENIHVKKHGKKTDPYGEEKKKTMVKQKCQYLFDMRLCYFVTYSFALTAAKKVDLGGKLIIYFCVAFRALFSYPDR